MGAPRTLRIVLNSPYYFLKTVTTVGQIFIRLGSIEKLSKRFKNDTTE